MLLSQYTAENSRHSEYDQYLSAHRFNVQRSWVNILKPWLQRTLSFDTIMEIQQAILQHDDSKFSSAEYPAYCNYFYPCDGYEKDEVAFKAAWLHHIHANPHHHQHWVLLSDNSQILILDMPLVNICEMLCDWHSLSADDPNSTAQSYWVEHHDEMRLSKSTVAIIDNLIDIFDKPLSLNYSSSSSNTPRSTRTL